MADVVDEAETLSSILKAQLDRFDGTDKEINQGDVAIAMGVDQSHLSRIKNDKASPRALRNLSGEQVYIMLDGFHLSASEIFRAAVKFSLHLPGEFRLRMQTQAAPNQPAQPILGLVRVRHLGEVNAGMRANGAYGDEMDQRELLADYLDGSDPANCFLLDVTGDSMTCEDIRKSIPAGSTLIVDPTLQPENGDPVVCEMEIAGERIGVVKLWRPTGRGIVLDSYNQDHPPVLLTNEMECILRGVVVNWVPPGRKALRRHFIRS